MNRKSIIAAVAKLAAVAAVIYMLIGNPLDPFDNDWFSSTHWKSGDMYAAGPNGDARRGTGDRRHGGRPTSRRFSAAPNPSCAPR